MLDSFGVVVGHCGSFGIVLGHFGSFWVVLRFSIYDPIRQSVQS